MLYIYIYRIQGRCSKTGQLQAITGGCLCSGFMLYQCFILRTSLFEGRCLSDAMILKVLIVLTQHIFRWCEGRAGWGDVKCEIICIFWLFLFDSLCPDDIPDPAPWSVSSPAPVLSASLVLLVFISGSLQVSHSLILCTFITTQLRILIDSDINKLPFAGIFTYSNSNIIIAIACKAWFVRDSNKW